MTDDPTPAEPNSAGPKDANDGAKGGGDAGSPPPSSQEGASGGSSGESSADVALAFATGEGAPSVGEKSAPGGASDGPDGANRERRTKKKRRKKPNPQGDGQSSEEPKGRRGGDGGGRGGDGSGRGGDGGGRGGAHGRSGGRGAGAQTGGRRGGDESVDRDAEHLARDARTVAHSRIRPIAECSRQVRRLIASRRARDQKEARRALVMLKSKVAYIAGREVGRERSALNKVRESIFKNVDHIVRNKDEMDFGQLRNFLDQLDAFVGYHRYTSDERRRD